MRVCIEIDHRELVYSYWEYKTLPTLGVNHVIGEFRTKTYVNADLIGNIEYKLVIL